MTTLSEKYVESGAHFSDDLKYRYSLWRVWEPKKAIVCFLMLNPSTADCIKNDPTVERCERRARMMGFGGMFVVNVFAYRATDPQVMRAQKDPVGPDNDKNILQHARAASLVICAWGNHGEFKDRYTQVLGMLRTNGIKLHHLGLTKAQQPRHPLYIPYETQVQPW